MSRKERIKLEIDILKMLIIAFLSAIFGIFGYCVLNYSHINLIQSLFIALGIILSFIALFLLSKRIYKILKEIEEL